MLLLDLDLDFFMDEVAYLTTVEGERLPEDQYQPWPASEVRRFLEEQCQLSRTARVRGRIVERHDEAFYVIRELVATRELVAPFDLCHVDAHADLGLGDSNWRYIAGAYLERSLEGRRDPPRDRINETNYLLYVLGCRWLSSLTYVPHTSEAAPQDLPPWWLDFNNEGVALQRYSVDTLQAWVGEQPEPLGLEPRIPFAVVAAGGFRLDRPPDMVVCSRSPEYTPPAADRLVPVVMDYLRAGV
jgi:UPF0489 domain